MTDAVENIDVTSKNNIGDSNDKSNKKKPKMMKNGLKDRPLKSWIRILAVTAVWWSFVIGFLCLCFFLMHEILYSSEKNTQPYFSRNFMKYPGILDQPSLNIMCLKSEKKQDKKCDTAELGISVNKIFNFVPKPFAKDEIPEELKAKFNTLGVNVDKIPDNQVYVTCDGRRQDDKDNLAGMKVKQDEAGINAVEFPWTSEKQSWPQVSLDLSNTKVVMAKTKHKVKVVMVCKAWAKNIEREDRFVDKKTPRGGVLAAFCFQHGGIEIGKKIGECE